MNTCYNSPTLMPFEVAKSTLLDSIKTITQIENILIKDADSRVIAQTITSPLNVPAFNNSAMDGYALRDDSLNDKTNTPLTQFKLVGKSMAGSAFTGQLKNGECIRIMTGAVVPETANAVVMQENIEQKEQSSNTLITLLHPVQYQSNIRFAGEDITENSILFDVGHKINAIDIGLLSSLGLHTVCVFRKLKVAVFSTGDELTMPGEELKPGHIYESNSQVLISMLHRLNMSVINLGIIKDNRQDIADAFVKADALADVVITSGGVSVGEADYTKEVLNDIGSIDFWKVAIKPGKPFAFGKLTNSIFFGLPGNPVSAAVTFHQLAMPALKHMSGAKSSDNKRLNAITTSTIKKRAGRMDFQRGIMDIDQQGNIQVTPLSAQGSGILSSISRANCYIILEQDNQGHKAGDTVKVELFDSIIG